MLFRLWITPAQAGKRQPEAQMQTSQQDHPRAGGEKIIGGLAKAGTWGSPPRRRGKATSQTSTMRSARDHPRAGGEKLKRLRKAYRGKGSPPRRRGKVKLLSLIGVTDMDHPRAGGEKRKTGLTSLRQTGSPPRRRGKVNHATQNMECERITPAQAGKSSFGLPSQTLSGDHPRAGGEKINVLAISFLPSGSPPRRRGKD